MREPTIIDRQIQMTQASPNPSSWSHSFPVRWLRKHWATRDDIIAWNERSSADAEQRVCHVCQMISDMLHWFGIGKKRS